MLGAQSKGLRVTFVHLQQQPLNRPYNMKAVQLTALLATAAFAVSSASGQIAVTQANIAYEEDFTSFTGTGFSPTPSAGQLDSNTWRVEGASDGVGTCGGTHDSGDFDRGSSSGGVNTGGVYAFDTGGGDIALGFQPAASDFTPGALTLRLQNSTGFAVTSLEVSYTIAVYNDQGRANSFNFAHSADDVSYTNEASLDYTTPEAADNEPAWVFVQRGITLSELNIADDGFYYLQWQTDDVSGGGSRDEFGITFVSFTAIPEPSTYAALFGALALGMVMFLRRRRR